MALQPTSGADLELLGSAWKEVRELWAGMGGHNDSCGIMSLGKGRELK